MSNMNVEENETSAALVSVLSKIDNRVDLSRKTPEEGEGLCWWRFDEDNLKLMLMIQLWVKSDFKRSTNLDDINYST